MFYVVFNTTAGWVGILGSASGLRCTTLPQRTERAVYELLGDSLKNATSSPRRFIDLIERYRDYFSRRRVDFQDKLDFTDATLFQRAVWQATRAIPYGQTRSYTWLAERVGNAKTTRAVGQALSRNPLPIIIPCHRVLAKNGGLGGFSGGLQVKKMLLRLEANPAANNRSNIR
jgi:methylated-DNA-[protein]-cysteine S-methyltransferase